MGEHRPFCRGLRLSVLILLSAPGAALADARKLDPFLDVIRKAPSEQVKRYAASVAVKPEIPVPTAEVLIRVRSGIRMAELAAAFPSVRFASQAGEIVTAEAPIAALGALSDDPRVRFVHASHYGFPTMDVVRSSQTQAGSIYVGALGDGTTALGLANGSGTIVGVVDTGVDWRHKDFVIGASSTSRILALWDQLDTGGPRPPGFSYGTEWTNAQITAELGASPPGIVREVDTVGHGTSVLGAAAGNGSATNGNEPAGKYAGMAPGADIIFVKTDISDSKVIDGVNYIVQKAASAGKRAVINLSLGFRFGPLDGTSARDSAINSVAASTPIVVAAGNDGARALHSVANFAVNGSTTIRVNIWDFLSSSVVFFWFPGSDGYTCTVWAPGFTGSVSASAGTNQSGSIGATNIDLFNGTDLSHPSGDRNISVQISQFPFITKQYFDISLTRTANGGSGRVDGWIYDANSTFTTHVDPTMTITEPATAPNVISVGGYNTKSTWRDSTNTARTDPSATPLGAVASFSSRGPTRDNRLKPDIAAPGQYVVMSRSANDSSSADSIVWDGRHVANAGTSFAAPIVAGAVALRLQQDPSLAPARIKALLTGKARTDSNVGSVPNNTWGYGKLLATPPAYPAPSGLSAAVEVTSITWHWTNIASNAAGVRVVSSVGASLSGDLPVDASSWTEVGLSTNTVYTRRVVTFNSIGVSTSVPLARFTRAAPPSGLSVAANSDTGFSVSWSPNSNPTGTAYVAQASTAGDFTGTIIASSTTGVSAAFSGLAPDTTYYVRLSAQNGDGVPAAFEGPAASTVTELSPPLGLAGQALGVSSIAWTWNSVSRATAYKFYPSTGGPPNALVSTTLRQLELSTNSALGARVAAVNSNGEGILTGLTTAYTLAATPSGSILTGVFFSSAAVAWSTNGNPPGTRYEVQWWAAQRSTVTISTQASSSFLAPLLVGDTVYIAVRALNDAALPAYTPFDVTLSTLLPAGMLAVGPGTGGTVVFQTGNGPTTVAVSSQDFSRQATITVGIPLSSPGVPTTLSALTPPVVVEITARDAAGNAVQPSRGVPVSVSYAGASLGSASADRLVLARYDTFHSAWVPLLTSRSSNQVVTALTDHFSLFQVMGAIAAGDLSQVSVGPNPLRPTLAPGQVMTFRNLPAGARVRLYTETGEVLGDVTADPTGIASWDGRNKAGRQVASGVYLALIEGAGATRVLGVAIER